MQTIVLPRRARPCILARNLDDAEESLSRASRNVPIDMVVRFALSPRDGSVSGMQGVVQSYDPATGDGVVMDDIEFNEYELAVDALAGSVFRMLRQGQRVMFEVNDAGLASRIRLGSEVDMETPELLPE